MNIGAIGGLNGTAVAIVTDPHFFAKAFCGELVPQDPNNEPADNLLEWIRAEWVIGQQKAAPLRRGRNKLENPGK